MEVVAIFSLRMSSSISTDSLKAALKAVNGIGDDGHGFRSALGQSQHRGEIFSLTARRRFDDTS
jgi:hypothetical protein